MNVVSPVFGTLSLLHVAEGEVVEEGDALCEVEAMKVFMRVPAPCSGKVSWLVELGEVVSEGDVLAEVTK